MLFVAIFQLDTPYGGFNSRDALLPFPARRTDDVGRTFVASDVAVRVVTAGWLSVWLFCYR